MSQSTPVVFRQPQNTSGIGEYVKLPIKQYPARAQRETAEGRYWRAYKSSELITQVGQVTDVSFAGVYPYLMAATSSARVTVYSSLTRRPQKNMTRFKDLAYSGVLRSDGRALAAGGQSGNVQLFDMVGRCKLDPGLKAPGFKLSKPK